MSVHLYNLFAHSRTSLVSSYSLTRREFCSCELIQNTLCLSQPNSTKQEPMKPTWFDNQTDVSLFIIKKQQLYFSQTPKLNMSWKWQLKTIGKAKHIVYQLLAGDVSTEHTENWSQNLNLYYCCWYEHFYFYCTIESKNFTVFCSMNWITMKKSKGCA